MRFYVLLFLLAWDFILTKTGKSWASKTYMNLLTKKSLQKLMQESTVNNYQILTYKISFSPFQHIVFGKS